MALDKTWLSSLKLSSSTWQMSKVRMYVTFLRSTLRDATVPMDMALGLRVRGAFAGLWEEEKKESGVFWEKRSVLVHIISIQSIARFFKTLPQDNFHLWLVNPPILFSCILILTIRV